MLFICSNAAHPARHSLGGAVCAVLRLITPWFVRPSASFVPPLCHIAVKRSDSLEPLAYDTCKRTCDLLNVIDRVVVSEAQAQNAMTSIDPQRV